jgi:hypothetical protein
MCLNSTLPIHSHTFCPRAFRRIKEIHAVVVFGCALSRLRFAVFGCALSRLRFADRACNERAFIVQVIITYDHLSSDHLRLSPRLN